MVTIHRSMFLGLAVVAALLSGGCSSGDDPAKAEFVDGAPAVKVSPGPGAGFSAKPQATRGKPQKNVTWTPTAEVKIKPVPTATTVKPGAVQKNVKYLNFCSPIGASGITKDGKKVTCQSLPGDDRARWRYA